MQRRCVLDARKRTQTAHKTPCKAYQLHGCKQAQAAHKRRRLACAPCYYIGAFCGMFTSTPYVWTQAARKTRNGVHWRTCARFVALFIKHNSTTYSHTTQGHGSHCERVDCTLSVPPMVGGFGVRYVEIKDFSCGSSMVCRKTANRSMRIVRLVGIKPLHSIGV